MYDPNLLSTYPNKTLLARLDNDNADALWQHFSIDQTKINKQSKFGNTLLMKASKQGCQNICDQLINFQAHLNLQNSRGETALMRAAAHGHEGIVTSLIHAEAKLDLQNNDGETALILACKLKHYEVAKLLIASNAEVRTISKLKVFTATNYEHCRPCFGSALLYAGLHHDEVVFNEILNKAGWKKIKLDSYKNPDKQKVDKLHQIKTYASAKCYGMPYLSVLLEGVLRSSSYLLFDYIIKNKMAHLDEDGFCYAVEHCQLSCQMIDKMVTDDEDFFYQATRALIRFTTKIKDENYLIDVAKILISAGADPSLTGAKGMNAIMIAKKNRLYKLEQFLLGKINTPIAIAHPITVNTMEPSAPLELDESEKTTTRFNMHGMKTVFFTDNTAEPSAPLELELDKSKKTTSSFNMYEMKTGA